MKAFLLALLHAAFNGAITGGAAAASGQASYKAIGLAALASALTGVVSFFSQSPIQPK